jgi:predicted dehydrogenase
VTANPASGEADDSSASQLDILYRTEGRTDYGIGAIGAGFIMRDIQLPAYRAAGFRTVAIASRTPANARAAAEQNGIDRVYDSWRELLADPEVEIVDIAYPPDAQLEIVRAACEAPQVRGILAQKPIAATLADAIEIERVCRESGTVLAVNQNMRHDQSMRALKTLLENGVIGTPIVAQIVMNARPHWQEFIRGYGRIAILNMSIHHLDVFRFLFGDPHAVMCSIRNDPSWDFAHDDGMAFYVLEYEDGLRCIGSDDCFTWVDGQIGWRVEGTDGAAKGTIGWPDYPAGSPSTIDYVRRADGEWQAPRWTEQWFPDAFAGTMAQLMHALETGTEPEISGRDNVRTMALVEAAYRAARERRTVEVGEVLAEAGIA